MLKYNESNAVSGAITRPRVSDEEARQETERRQRIRDMVDKIVAQKGETPLALPPIHVIPDSEIAGCIDDAKKRLYVLAWRMKKHYPADFKDFTKRLDEIAGWLLEHKHSNDYLFRAISLLGGEIASHPVSEEVAALENDRNSILSEFGKNHKIAVFGGKVCVRREDKHDWILPEQLRQFYAHIDVPGDDGRPQNVVSAFMQWGGAHRYNDVVFNPGRPGHYDDHYNMWQGWMVEPEVGDDDAPWWDVLKAACGYNDDYIEYVTKWFADIVQNPTRKPGTAIGISGRQGVGKSALVETIGMLMSTINRAGDSKIVRGAFGDFTIDELLADYNEHVANKLLVYLDEATWGGSHIEQQRMKKIITKETETINPKFLGRIMLPCYRREVFTSNNAFYYRPDKDDRRLLPLEYDASKINDKIHDFWSDFYDKRKNGKMLSNLLLRLQSVDLKGWHPQTALKKLKITTGASMLSEALQPWEHWLEEIASNGSIVIEEEGEKRKFEMELEIENHYIDDKAFQAAYLLWCRKNNVRASWYADAFKKERTKMLGEQVRKMVSGDRQVGRKVPSSAEMLRRLYEGRRWVPPVTELEEQPQPEQDRDGNASAHPFEADHPDWMK